MSSSTPHTAPPGVLEQGKDTPFDVHINGFDQAKFEQSSGHHESSKPSKKQEVATDKQAIKQQNLTQLLERERALAVAATRKVVFSPPLISRNGTGVIGRNTINIIQGAYGSHKSRLGELVGSLMLADNPDDPQYIGFERAKMERFCVCYIDSERNQSEELPFAIQGMKLKAGFSLTDQPDEFRFTSIKAIERPWRFEAIEAFISHVRENTALHLFCLIDVVTDAISDFNDPKESMKLFDFLGNLCDRHNATFLLIIHQNPGTEKGRGHAGTEGANKASTILQIGFEKDASGNDTDLIRLKYLKLRRGKRPEPVFLQFCQQSNGLILADAASISAHINQRKHKADSEDIADRLLSLLSEGALPKNEVWTILESEFKASNATIRGRLKTIIADPPAMFDEEGRAVMLGEYSEGKNQFFRLNLIE